MKYFLPVLIALLCSLGSFSQIQTAGSYANISRPSGGPVVTGDVIEVRAVISVNSGTTITGLRYTSTVPTGTSFVNGSLKAVTNEGLVVAGIANTGSYTNAAGDDRGRMTGGNIVIFMGTGANATTGGSVTGAVTTPVFYTNASILMATYRVTVTATSGTVITINGSYRYVNSSGTTITNSLALNNIAISPSFTCISSAAANLLTSETNGSFGSGTAHNRATASANVTGFTFQNLATSSPQDAEYSIAKNTSPTQYTGSSPTSGDKVFTAWDIIGDHTGTATGAGNPPSPSGASGGYMLVVNASYAPAIVYTTTIGGLTTNTTYTLSFWLRNICTVCGFDPTTGNSTGTPGIKPNVAFDINGVNYFSTGDMTYTNQWVQRSFTFNSGVLTSATVTIKNNAPGGGGNDWALDDLSLTRCLIVLPVTLKSFEANVQEGGVLLTWETEMEQNAASYEVERSIDGEPFNTIGHVAAHSLYQGSAYTFADKTIDGQHTITYRLRMIDADGQFAYSRLAWVKGNNTALQAFTLTPNPAKGSTSLNIIADMAEPVSVDLLSMAGRQVYTQQYTLVKGYNRLKVPFSNTWPPGMYLVRLATGKRTTYTKLLIE